MKKRAANCVDCQILLPIERPIYWGSRCRNCWLDSKKLHRQIYKETILEDAKQYYRDHKQEKLIYAKQYRNDHPEELKEYFHNYYQENKEEIKIKNNKPEAKAKRQASSSKYHKNRYNNDPKYKLRSIISNNIGKALKRMGNGKNGKSSIKHLSYTIKELEDHLESLFSHPNNLDMNGNVWMTWYNHGIYNADKWDDNDPSTWTWQIDHIIPQSVLPFDSLEHENLQKCWALSNLQPLSAKENNAKSNKILEITINIVDEGKE